MAKKLTDEQKQFMLELRKEGLAISEVARRAGVSYGSAYGCTRAKERGFRSTTDYLEYRARERGYPSYDAYLEHRAVMNGHASRNDYNQHLLKNRGAASNEQSREDFAKWKGFPSDKEYQKYLAKNRQELPTYQQFSGLIRQKLTELGQTETWLAEQIGVSPSAISRYCMGEAMPRKPLQEGLFEALELPYHTLDDIIG